MTNREKHHRFVEEELLPLWKLRRLACWYWMKVTPQGELVGPLVSPMQNLNHTELPICCLFDCPVMRCYLSDVALKRCCGSLPALLDNWVDSLQEVAHRRPYETILIAAHEGYRPYVPVPENFCIFSVPGEHSRKPHLGRLIAPYLPDKPDCMEVKPLHDPAASSSWEKNFCLSSGYVLDERYPLEHRAALLLLVRPYYWTSRNEMESQIIDVVSGLLWFLTEVPSRIKEPMYRTYKQNLQRSLWGVV